jgi:hypothetical protein
MAGHGGARKGAGRPLGGRSTRPSAKLIELARVDESLIPVKFEGDSLEFLRATMTGKIWPTREQIYAAKSMLLIEHPPAVTVDGRNVEEIGQAAIREYQEACEADDVGELLIRRIQRLREETAPSERARHMLEEVFGDDIGDADRALIDQVCDRLDELRPAVGRVDAILPPAPRELVFSKRSPATIDGEAETPSAAGVGNARVSAADGGPIHTSVHNSVTDEPPVKPSPVETEMVPTLAGNGRIRWVPRQ